MRQFLVSALALACLGCSSIEPVTLPKLPVAEHFREGSHSTGGPSAARAVDASWWKAYQDAELDRLQLRLLDNSPDLGSALARYEQARAGTAALRSEQLPTVSASTGLQRDRQSDRRPLRVLGPNSPDEYNDASVGLSLSYELDFWGRVRRRVEAGQAEENAAGADLAAARIALQAQLADTMFALRGLDAEVALLRETEVSYGRASDLITRRHRGGIASGLDLARANTQLETTRSQLHQAMARRALLEHSIAALVGESASTFTIEPRVVTVAIPVVPTGLPSDLLQRRPDIAAAQQRVIAANASVGVARTAFFPSLVLGAQAGVESSDLSRILEAPNLFWALGPTLMTAVFDGGRRKAEVARTEAVLDEAGQRYRGVVVSAFQQVEDQLALLDRYAEAATDERAAVTASRHALDLATDRYTNGAANYLEVVTAQTADLEARRSATSLATLQQRATVQLFRALGGGWTATNT